MPAEAKTTSDEILKETMDELSTLRQKALALPDQTLAEAAIEAIDFYEEALPTYTIPLQPIEWCGRALADVRHEVAAAEYGYESPQADAVFEAGEREFNELLFVLRQASEAKDSDRV
jgi:hypothetical protein